MTDEVTTPEPDEPPAQASAAEPVETPAEEPAAAPDADSIPVDPDAEPAPPGPTATEAWDDVVSAIGDLGDAFAAWARAATDNPENRHHVDEIRASVNDMAKKADAVFADVASSDVGKQMRQGADDAGQAFADTAQKVSEAAAPHVATAFAGLADVFGRVAQRAGDAAKSPAGEPPTREAPEPPVQPQPAAPAQAMPPSSEDAPEE
jgi:hypothetical protein